MESKYVDANGIDIHYREAGSGPPLVLLHGGVVSSNPLWGPHPFAYAAHVEALSKHFRVIAPDTRGCGRTVHSGGTITFDLLADDVLALIRALRLERPALCGFSEGGITATIAAIRGGEAASVGLRAVVNDAGFDVFNPTARSFMMMRQMLGGTPEATRADPAAAERFFQSSPEMRKTFELLQADHDGGQGKDFWKTYLGLAFHRTTQPPGYTLEDFARVPVPTLIVVGDRDDFCPIEDGARAYRALKVGQFGVLPATGHFITPSKVALAVEFLSNA
jgi:pimeloyl-ACP methyl ester carboxylesterase